MFRINRLSDYALVICGRLGSGQGAHPQSAPDLAETTRLPLPTVTKILKSLARAGILESVRGAHGGYRLTRQASSISVLEVLEAMEGRLAITECVEVAGGGCAYETGCVARGPWERINAALRAALSQVALAELDETSPGPLVPIPAQGAGCEGGVCGAAAAMRSL